MSKNFRAPADFQFLLEKDSNNLSESEEKYGTLQLNGRRLEFEFREEEDDADFDLSASIDALFALISKLIFHFYCSTSQPGNWC